MKIYILDDNHEKSFNISENPENPIMSSIKEKLMLKKGEIDTLNFKKWEIRHISSD